MKLIRKLPIKDRKRIREIMDEYHRDFQMVDGWDPGNKEENFRILARIALYAKNDYIDKSILDVGCGSGDLSHFLRQFGISDYVGIDIYEPSLDRALETYPKERFILGDILSGDVKESFDYSFCSGGLTVKMSINNYDFLYSTIRRMWELTRIGLAFNYLTDTDQFPDEDLFFYNTEKVKNICSEIDPTAAIISEKTPNKHQDTIFMWRKVNIIS